MPAGAGASTSPRRNSHRPLPRWNSLRSKAPASFTFTDLLDMRETAKGKAMLAALKSFRNG